MIENLGHLEAMRIYEAKIRELRENILGKTDGLFLDVRQFSGFPSTFPCFTEAGPRSMALSSAIIHNDGGTVASIGAPQTDGHVMICLNLPS